MSGPNELNVAEGLMEDMKRLRDALKKFPRLWVVVYRGDDGKTGYLTVMNATGGSVSDELGVQILDFAKEFLGTTKKEDRAVLS